MKFSVKVSVLSVKLLISQCTYFATLNIIMNLHRTRRPGLRRIDRVDDHRRRPYILPGGAEEKLRDVVQHLKDEIKRKKSV